jgi:uncharacterized protein YbbC (DUF1343 family)
MSGILECCSLTLMLKLNSNAMIRMIFLLLSILLLPASCSVEKPTLVTGAERVTEYLPLLKGKKVAIAANQTTMVGDAHLVDLLIGQGVEIEVIFAPEHGFRDMADAGQSITGGVDEVTGVKVVSLYGTHYKPLPEDLEGIDIVIFDIQDVGLRFYTYISTMHYIMEACAENNVGFMVLDRPNPNGFYFDGPVREPEFKSFVGMHPVPVVHGMTVGEYATMVNGEGWLTGGIKCDLTVIECLNYTHSTLYELPVKPSPNLPNQNSVYLYASVCFFEGTNVSLGRGTDAPFQMFGAPELKGQYEFSFTPESRPGAMNPPLLGKICYGKDLRNALATGVVPVPRIELSWVIEAYNAFPDKTTFFKGYFDTLAGTDKLRKQIIEGLSQDEIRETWKSDLDAFALIRNRYLIYPE